MFKHRMTEPLRRAVARLEFLRAELDRGELLPRRWMGRLRRELEAEAVAASTSMEGVPVTVDEVRRILAGDRPQSVAPADARLVEGYRAAMAFILRRADAAAFRWQRELFISVHDHVLGGSYALGAGDFRQRMVYVGSAERGIVYEPPAPELVAAEVDALAAWLDAAETSALAVPVRAALAHVRLAAIHPFTDGNGRVARILATLVMLRGGYRRPEFTSLEEWWGRHQASYYGAFDCLGPRWAPEVDVTPFVLAHVEAQVAQVEALSLRQATERAIWTVLEDLVTEDLGALPRLADALFDAFFGRTVTNRYYRSLSDTSAATAATDLGRLSAAGLLAVAGAGRSTTYLGTPLLIQRVAAATGAPPPDERAPLEAGRAGVVAALAGRVRRGVGVRSPD